MVDLIVNELDPSRFKCWNCEDYFIEEEVFSRGPRHFLNKAGERNTHNACLCFKCVADKSWEVDPEEDYYVGGKKC